MIRKMKEGLNVIFGHTEDDLSPTHYKALKRNIITLMLIVAVVPLALMTVINHYQYQSALHAEVLRPVRSLLAKTKNTFELFLAERQSAVSFITHAYTYEELADRKKLTSIFEVMRADFGGFVDLGLIDSRGIQVNYTGPYNLQGKDYSNQSWFQEVKVRGAYTSDVFLGYRRFPHFVIAVMHGCPTDAGCWTVRATIDTQMFSSIIASMGLDANSDAFIINRDGVMQTSSKFYGDVLQTFPLPIPPTSYEPTVIETVGKEGRDIVLGYVNFVSPAYILMVVKRKADLTQSWTTLKGEMLLLFLVSAVLIFLVVYRLTGQMVRRIEIADQKRQMVYHEMQYTNKLASIGRLAAGVAHEINNPLAIINEKAGLMKDLIEYIQDFSHRERFLPLVESILKSVDRCRTITHRLLGFARRMDVAIEVMDLNEVIEEVLSFIEKEALHRNIHLELDLDENLPQIASDHGQLQQVFLNILNNAFAAVEDGGRVRISAWEKDADTIGVSIVDNGSGMTQETMKHIFEPFYTTKKGQGTGLGLSITYGIVKKLGGEIEVQSSEGQGTTFTVYLPKKVKEGAVI